MEQSKPSLLEELNKTVQMSLEVTNIILPKIEDNALREVVLNQRKHYEELIEKINELCTARKLKVTVPKFDSMMLWGSIQMHTLKDCLLYTSRLPHQLPVPGYWVPLLPCFGS